MNYYPESFISKVPYQKKSLLNHIDLTSSYYSEMYKSAVMHFPRRGLVHFFADRSTIFR